MTECFMFQIEESDAIIVVDTTGSIQVSEEIKDNQVDSPPINSKFRLTIEPMVMLLLLGASTSSE